MLILILNLVPLGVPKDVLMQNLICKHKGDNSNTLVPTTAMRPDATAKRYSRGT